MQIETTRLGKQLSDGYETVGTKLWIQNNYNTVKFQVFVDENWRYCIDRRKRPKTEKGLWTIGVLKTKNCLVVWSILVRVVNCEFGYLAAAAAVFA